MKSRGSRKSTSARTNTTRRASTRPRTAKKAARPAARSSMSAAPEDFDQYLATIPEAARKPVVLMREVIRSVVPAEATELISYGIPAFKHKKILVWFGGFSIHCSLYPTAAVLKAFEDDLKGYTTSKGTVQFPLHKPLPVALIKKLVKARVAIVRE